MGDDSAQLPGPCQRRGRVLAVAASMSAPHLRLPEIDRRPGIDRPAPTGRRYRPTRSGRAHSRSETRPTEVGRVSTLRIGPGDRLARYSGGRRGRVGRDAGAASAAAPMSASGRRGRAGTARRIPASGVRTQHGPALNARSGPAGRPLRIQGGRERSDQPGPGRVRSSDGPTLTRGRRRMSQRRRDRAFDADGARAGSVPAAGTTPCSNRVPVSGAAARRASASSRGRGNPLRPRDR